MNIRSTAHNFTVFDLMSLLRLGCHLKIRQQTARALDQAVHAINWKGAKSICYFCCPLRDLSQITLAFRGG